MTPDEINRRISTWAGLDSHVCDEWSFHCDDCERGSIQTPDYFGSNAAMDLLAVLVERGYWWELVGEKDGYGFANGNCRCTVGNYKSQVGHIKIHESAPTIPAAICTAILELIEREGKE